MSEFIILDVEISLLIFLCPLVDIRGVHITTICLEASLVEVHFGVEARLVQLGSGHVQGPFYEGLLETRDVLDVISHREVSGVWVLPVNQSWSV